MEPVSGQKLGRYTLTTRLGAGGMAEVWAATDELLKRRVAVKIVRGALAESPEFSSRFLREARLAAQLQHSGIVAVFDVGLERDALFVVMPVLSGGSLSDRLAGPVDDATALAWLGTLAGALDYAHGKGIVHRDVKPLNVLFDEEDSPHLADFGLAKGLDEATQLTHTGMILGTPLYMSPEQAMGTTAGPAADQYSLGIVAYRLLAGRLPFEKEPTPVLLRRTAFEEMPPPSRFRAGLPPAVDAVFARVLAKPPEARFPSCGAFVVALARALHARDDSSPSAPGPPEAKTRLTTPPPVGPVQGARPTPPPLPVERKRVHLGLALLVGVFALLLAGSLWIVLRPGTRPEPSAPPGPAAIPTTGPTAAAEVPPPTRSPTPTPVETPFTIAVPLERPTPSPRPTSTRIPSPAPAPSPSLAQPPLPLALPSSTPTAPPRPRPTDTPPPSPPTPTTPPPSASPTPAVAAAAAPSRPSPASGPPADAADPLASIPRRSYPSDQRLKDAWLEVEKVGCTLHFQFTRSLEGKGENIGTFGTLSVTTRGGAPLVPGARSPLPLLCKGLDSRKVTCAVPPPADPYSHLAVRLGEGDRVAVRAVLSGFSFSATLRIED